MSGSQYTVRPAPARPGGDLRLLELALDALGVRQPVAHTHVAVHRGREREMLASPIALGGSPEQAAETEVAVRYERPHPELLGQPERVAIMRFAARGVEPVRMRSDVAEQVLRVSGKAATRRKTRDGLLAQAPRLVEPSHREAGTAQGLIAPRIEADDSGRREAIEEHLTFFEPAQHLAGLAAELRQCPRGERDGIGKHEDDVARAE